MKLQVKICGLSTPEAVDAAISGGARYIGLVFYARSPRAVDAALAAQLARRVPTGVPTVGLFVEPDDEFLESVLGRVPLDLLQLPGDEEPDRKSTVSGQSVYVRVDIRVRRRIITKKET